MAMDMMEPMDARGCWPPSPRASANKDEANNFEELLVENVESDDQEETRAGEDAEETTDAIPAAAAPADEVLKDDFFEAEPEKKEEYGDIEGMDATAGDEEATEEKDEPAEASVPAESLQAQSEEESVHFADVEVREAKTSVHETETPQMDLRQTTRRSIHYDMESRIVKSDTDINEFFDLGKQDAFILMDEFVDSVAEESEPTMAEEEEEALDRVPYYEKYAVISDQITVNRIKNNLLQKLVIMYLKRRKMENILKDSEPPLDQVIKYGQKLDAYEQLMEINDTERNTVSTEVAQLKQKREEQKVELAKLFKAMQSKEISTGYGLIYAKTGNEISDKLVERFIKRQTTQMDQVSTMRLKFIKLKDMVQEKLDAIEKLDHLENNLRLADFEQLKAENRAYADKLEERDEELTRLRFKCQNTIQVLAHMREKSAALDSDVADLQDEYETVEGNAMDYRERLAYLKRSRDHFRHLVRKLKEESGLLTKPELLRDMEESMEESRLIEMDLIKCKEEVDVKKSQVRALRKHIEEATEEVNRRRSISKRRAPSQMVVKKEDVYKGRPTLYMPVIEQSAFDDLVKIKPGPKMSSRRQR